MPLKKENCTSLLPKIVHSYLPKIVHCYFPITAIYLGQLGDDIGAEKQYDKAIELDPKNADYYISRGWSRLKNKKTDACADWSKAGELGNYEAYDLIQKYCK